MALRVARRIGLLLLCAGAAAAGGSDTGLVEVETDLLPMLLWCLGVKTAVAGGPIRNLPGVLVVSDHMSCLTSCDRRGVAVKPVAGIAAVVFARGDVAGTVAVRMMARIVKVIPIQRARLRQPPEVVATVAARLYAGRTVVAFPEATTWCGLSGRTHQGSGPFYPAMFQAAVDTGRPVQPLRLRYQHRDGQVSTVPAYIGDDTLLRSIAG